MPSVNQRLTIFEQAVLAKLDTLIANQSASNAAVLHVIEDHLRYLRISDMRRYGQVGDTENLPPATIDQP